MMSWLLRVVCTFVAIAGSGGSAGAQITAGIASTSIAPGEPAWLAGDPGRFHPSASPSGDIRARALAIDDGSGGRAVLISVELLGVPRALSEMTAADIMRALGLDRGQILIEATGTRNAPFVQGLQPVLAPDGVEEQRRIGEYSARLSRSLVELARTAFANMQPVRLGVAFGHAALPAHTGRQSADDLVDATIHVVRVQTASGKTLAVVFGYSGGAAALGEDPYAMGGDSAGVAARTVERDFPGSVALFLQLCDSGQALGSQGSSSSATSRGATLAAEVGRLLALPMQGVKGRVRTALIETSLSFRLPTRAELETELKRDNPARARWAKRWLADDSARSELPRMPYAVQVMRFDKGFALVALSGHPSASYAAGIRKLLARESIIVTGGIDDAGYCVPGASNPDAGDAGCADSIVYSGLPGAFASETEERILDAVKRAWQRALK